MPAHRLLGGLCASVALAACGGGGETAAGSTSTAPAAPVASAEVAAVELVTGDCVSGLVIGAAERTTVESVRVVDCGSVHELEIFATFDVSPADFDATEGDEYPGEQRVVRAADQGCAARLEELDAADDFGLIAIWPTDTSWLQGDRRVKCAAFRRGGEPFQGRGLLARRGR